MKTFLKLFAPTFSVLIFWCFFNHAWAAILGYHAQILFWRCDALKEKSRTQDYSLWWLMVPTVFAGPLVYFLTPYIAQIDLSQWLSQYHLTGWAFLLMIPYFGLLHPILEQLHWAPLREQTKWAYVIFAGYHLLVLNTFLKPLWLIVCFVVLCTASMAWTYIRKKTGSNFLPVLSHIVADLSIIIAAWFSL